MPTYPATFPHAVHQLFQYRKSISTRPFNARGSGVQRCDYCRIDIKHCICELLKPQTADASFVLLMFDDEVLKPSNTGRLIADVLPDTQAFLWDRTQISPEFISLINSPKYQPILVFPDEYALDEQPLLPVEKLRDRCFTEESSARPLFIMLDATWRQARKMYRKSPYLHNIPMLSIPAELMAKDIVAGIPQAQTDSSDSPDSISASRYHVRTASKEQQLATAEVAARVLQLSQNTQAGDVLALWFHVFSYRYQCGVKQTNSGDAKAVERYLSYLDKTS